MLRRQKSTSNSTAQISGTYLISRILSSSNISLISLTLPAPEAGGFMDFILLYLLTEAIPLVAPSQGWIRSRSIAGIAGSNPAGRYLYLSRMNICVVG